MEVTSGAEEGFVREWAPCTHMLSLIPPRVQNGLFSKELYLTCIDAVSEYIALGTNFGLVYWYDRKKGNIQRLRCEASTSPITFVKIVSTVDFMVGAGNAAGQVTVFQIPKEHPDSVPESLKPKVEPKVERYTIGDLHKSKVTAIEWSKNGMRLFSGDKNGVIIMTEIDFYMHLCKSQEIVNEQHEIVQLSYHQSSLLVSSVYRAIVCERRDGRWHVSQVGTKERNSLCPLGAVFQHSYASGSGGSGGSSGEVQVYCARRGARLWRADRAGNVQQTLIFKDAIANPLTYVELLNPSQKRLSTSEVENLFGRVLVLKEQFLVTYSPELLFILEPRSLTAVASLTHLRKILSVSVNKDEIFILEGPRSVVRLGHAPEPGTMHADDPINQMTKSLTSSLQQAVNTVRDFTHLDQTVPFITSVLEQPISLLTKNEFIDTSTVASAEECFELPPIKSLPPDVGGDVLESIINEFKDVSSETEELRRVKSEEIQRKLKMYNSIMEKRCEEDLIHSRRSRRREVGSAGSAGGTPRFTTPVRKREEGGDGVSYTSPCVMNLSVYGNLPQETDDILEKQIEEKEKILAKMLNLESLSIKSSYTYPEDENRQKNEETITQPKELFDKSPPSAEAPQKTDIVAAKPVIADKKAAKTRIDPLDLVPKLVKLPNNWNLGDIELKLDIPSSNGVKNGQILSPDDHIEKEWEFV